MGHKWNLTQSTYTKVSTVALKAINVVLKITIHLKPYQSKIIKGDLQESAAATPRVFIISPIKYVGIGRETL